MVVVQQWMIVVVVVLAAMLLLYISMRGAIAESNKPRRWRQVPLSRNTYIPISRFRLIETMLSSLWYPEEREQLSEIIKRIETVYHLQHNMRLRQMEQDFEPFDRSSPRFNHFMPADPYQFLCNIHIDAAEDRFLDHMSMVLEKANFHPLTTHDMDICKAVNYMFTIPVDVHWDKLDRRMIRRFLRRRQLKQKMDELTARGVKNESLLKQMSSGLENTMLDEWEEFSDRVLIFHRGVGIATTSGLLIGEKINEISNILLTQLYGWPSRLAERRKQRTQPHLKAAYPSVAAADSAAGGGSSNDGSGSDTDSVLSPDWKSADDGLGAATSAAQDQAKDEAMREAMRRGLASENVVQRMTLTDQMRIIRTPLGYLKALFTTTTLREPTFKELVVIYRRATEPEEPEENRETIIKTFRDIPMADLEMILPEKSVRMRPMDMLSFLITAVLGLLTVISQLYGPGNEDDIADDPDAEKDPYFLYAVVLSLIAYSAKTYYYFTDAKERYQSTVIDALYDKSQDSNGGVLFHVMNKMETEELKESALAYFLLWQEGPQTAEDLAALANAWIKEKFGVAVSFDIEDALAKNTAEGLVVVQNSVYTPLKPEAAIKVLGDSAQRMLAEGVLGLKKSGSTLGVDRLLGIFK